MSWLVLALMGCTGPIAPVDSGDLLPERDDLLGIGLAPRDPVTRVGDSVPFFATAYYDNTEYEDITASVSWSSTDERVATVGSDGVAFAVGEGEATIIAAATGGTSNQVSLRVVGGAVQLTGVTIQPASVALYVGETAQLSAVASYDDGSTGTLGSGCNWGSENGAIASVDAGALVIAEAPGVTNVIADCSGFQSASAVEVVEETVDLGAPDLRVVSVEGVGIGQEVLWLVEVENSGTALAGGFFVDAFLDGESGPSPGDTIDASQYIAGLGPGESNELYLEMTGAPVGSFNSYIAVDLDGFVVESDEDNNLAGPIFIDTELQTLGPDLTITEAFAFTDGFLTEYLIEIQNVGDSVATGFWLDLYLDAIVDPDTCELGDRYIQITDLGPGQTFVWDPIENDAPISSWISYVFVDSCDDIVESDEGNNLVSFIVEE